MEKHNGKSECSTITITRYAQRKYRDCKVYSKVENIVFHADLQLDAYNHRPVFTLLANLQSSKKGLVLGKPLTVDAALFRLKIKKRLEKAFLTSIKIPNLSIRPCLLVRTLGIVLSPTIKVLFAQKRLIDINR